MKRYIRATTLDEMLDASWMEKMNAAENPSTPAELLSKLSTDDESVIRQSVAKNISTPSTTLAQLAKDTGKWVRSAVAENPSTPADTLRQLAHDDCVWVRMMLAQNDNIPQDVAEVLAEDKDSTVRALVKEQLRKIATPSTPSKPLKPKRLSWPKLISQLRREAEDGVDSLYEQTSAGDEISSFCTAVENKLGIWLEPSIQGGQGGIWFYSSEDNSTLAADYDYQTYNENVISLALQSKNATEFKNEYESFVQSILDDPAYAPEVDE